MPLNLSQLKPLFFDWDEHNQYKNWHKHQVKFRECEQVFSNEPLKTLLDIKHSQKEPRFTALGRTNKGRKLIITFTIRSKKIRVISARNQSRKERGLYEEKEK